MPIRLVDGIPARLGTIPASLANVSADFDGTHTAPPARAGAIAALAGQFTSALVGQFQANSNRSGTIVVTLAGMTAAFRGTSAPPIPLESFFSVTPPSLTEGDSGNKNFPFLVTSSQTHSFNVLFDYITVQRSGSDAAVAGVDYVHTEGTGTLTAGQLSTTINVPVIGDTTIEPNELFDMVFSNFRSA